MDYNKLKKTPLFEGISEIELEKVFAGLNTSEVHFHKGEVMARINEPCNRLITILSGVAKGEMSDPSGKVVKVEDIPTYYSVATLFVFSRGKNFPVQVIAKEEVSALVIPSNALFLMLTRNETLLKNFLYLSTLFAHRLVHRLHVMAFLTIRKKIAMYLLELNQLQKSDTVIMGMTHAALAEYFGVSRQALERELKHLEAGKMILTEHKKITLLNKAKLEYMIKF